MRKVLGSRDLKDMREVLNEVLKKLWASSMSRWSHKDEAWERSSKGLSVMRGYESKIIANSSMYDLLLLVNPPFIWVRFWKSLK